MFLLIHILIALTTVLFATYNLIIPSEQRIKITYVLLAGTIGSAIVLIFTRHVNLGHTCLTGIAYVALVSVGILLTKRRLAEEKS